MANDLLNFVFTNNNNNNYGGYSNGTIIFEENQEDSSFKIFLRWDNKTYELANHNINNLIDGINNSEESNYKILTKNEYNAMRHLMLLSIDRDNDNDSILISYNPISR